MLQEPPKDLTTLSEKDTKPPQKAALTVSAPRALALRGSATATAAAGGTSSTTPSVLRAFAGIFGHTTSLTNFPCSECLRICWGFLGFQDSAGICSLNCKTSPESLIEVRPTDPEVTAGSPLQQRHSAAQQAQKALCLDDSCLKAFRFQGFGV